MLSEKRTDFDGNPILDSNGLSIRVYRSHHLRRAVKALDGRTREAKRLRMILPHAEAFEASAYEQACYSLARAESDLHQVASKIRDSAPSTLGDLAIKASAILTMQVLGNHAYRYYAVQAGPLLATAL